MIETRFKDTEVGRIPEDWEVKALGDVLSVGNGRDYKHLSFGDIPVYGTGGYMTSVSDYLHDGETVCIGRKGTIDDRSIILVKYGQLILCSTLTDFKMYV